MLNPSDAVTEVIGAIRGVLGLTRQSRLREQINDTTELYAKVHEHDDLREAAIDIARVVKLQAARLLAAAEPTTRRAWAWGSFSVGLFFTLLVAGPTGWIYVNVHRHWWVWVAIVILGMFALLLLAVSISLLVEPQGAEAERKAARASRSRPSAGTDQPGSR